MLNTLIPAPLDQRCAADLDDAIADFTRLRPRLLGIAHRMLGSWTEAEDTVQEAWLRWQSYDRTKVLNATAFLVTTTTRLALNTAQSARSRRESYVGNWVSEPVDATNDPAAGAERRDDLEHGIGMLLQRLSPRERAAFVLRQAFDYPYSQIAAILHLSEPNARQLVSRAGRRLAAQHTRPASTTDGAGLLRAFVAASQHGEVAVLERALALAS
jgi:RNA polymerase sigma-70 factor (ECF subfamily)